MLKPVNVALLVFAALGLAFNIWISQMNRGSWGADFNQFYAASRLAGTGHLYDWDALRKIEAETGEQQPSGRLPVVIYGHKILGCLPYTMAQVVWFVCSLVSLAVFAAIWPGARRSLIWVALAWSTPAAMVLSSGQDSPYWLLFFASGLLLIEKKRPWIAGFAFSLCICKFHLALGLPVMLVAQKRWKTLIASSLAVTAWLGACFLIEGADWPRQYGKISQIPAFSPAAERMPNLHGVASWFRGAMAIEIVCALAVVWLLWVTCRDNNDLGITGAATAACGLLLGHHAYAYDCVLLIPLAVLTLQQYRVAQWMRFWAVVVLSPVTVLLLTSQRPLAGQVLVNGFVVAAIVMIRSCQLPSRSPSSLAVCPVA